MMPPALTYNTATNRITGPGVYGFDSTGNMIQDPLNGTTTYTYNADNHVTTAVRNSVTVGTYTYDGEGRRVKRVASGVTTRYIFDARGKLVAEYTGSTPTLDREYVASAVIIPASQPAPGGDANNRTQYLTSEFREVLNFMRTLGEVLDKPVILTPENGPEHPLITYDPRCDHFEWHE